MAFWSAIISVEKIFILGLSFYQKILSTVEGLLYVQSNLFPFSCNKAVSVFLKLINQLKDWKPVRYFWLWASISVIEKFWSKTDIYSIEQKARRYLQNQKKTSKLWSPTHEFKIVPVIVFLSLCSMDVKWNHWPKKKKKSLVEKKPRTPKIWSSLKRWIWRQNFHRNHTKTNDTWKSSFCSQKRWIKDNFPSKGRTRPDENSGAQIAMKQSLNKIFFDKLFRQRGLQWDQKMN